MSSPALPLPAVASSVKHKRGSSASSFTSQVTPPAKLFGLVPRRVYLLVLALVLVVLFPPRPPLPPSYKATWRTERALARAFPDNAAKDTKLLLVQTRSVRRARAQASVRARVRRWDRYAPDSISDAHACTV